MHASARVFASRSRNILWRRRGLLERGVCVASGPFGTHYITFDPPEPRGLASNSQYRYIFRVTKCTGVETLCLPPLQVKNSKSRAAARRRRKATSAIVHSRAVLLAADPLIPISRGAAQGAGLARGIVCLSRAHRGAGSYDLDITGRAAPRSLSRTTCGGPGKVGKRYASYETAGNTTGKRYPASRLPVRRCRARMCRDTSPVFTAGGATRHSPYHTRYHTAASPQPRRSGQSTVKSKHLLPPSSR